MGVKGLQYYIEHHCPDSCRNISILQMADNHRIKYNCDPILVVDGMSLIYPLYSSSLEWVYGGQWLQFLEKLKNFINRFEQDGVRLVFFFDGTVSSRKRKEWIKRRVSKYKQISTVLNDIKIHGREPEKKLFQLPTSMGTITRFALKELGAEVYQTDREADEVIADYAARRKDVFAILSQDTDFIIYNTKPYLSMQHLNLNTLQTIFYDREYFSFHYLQLPVSKLPLLACLLGNDVIPVEKLKHFHQRISYRYRCNSIVDNIQNIIQIINTEGWEGNFNNVRELDRISYIVFGSVNWSKLIYDGLKSYVIGDCFLPPAVCVSVHPNLERAVYERHINCLNGPFIFNLLCNMEYESSEVLEDPSWLPSALTYRKIRQRCYGILFNCFFQCSNSSGQIFTKDGSKIFVKEWCAYDGNLMENPDSIEPLPLLNFSAFDRDIPSIEHLWFTCTPREKLKFFWSIIQAPLNFELLYVLPKHLIVFCCILNYLIGSEKNESFFEIQPWEIAVFIGQALWRKNSEELSKIEIPRVDSTAVHLATLFMRGISTAMMVLGTCGNPIDISYAMPWHFFDGKLFHFLYVKSKERPSISKLCGNQEELNEFYQLLPVVINNTRYEFNKLDWKNILEDFEENCVVYPTICEKNTDFL